MSRRFDDLVALQQKLLSPEGCPWDRQQTHETLRTYLLEETYEVLDAIDSGDPAKFSEELGDLLLQIVFHADLAQAAGRFDIGDVIESIYLKMVRRHPHVFGDAKAHSAADVLNKWEHLKAEERRQKQAASLPVPGAAAAANVAAAGPDAAAANAAVGALLAAPSSAASSPTPRDASVGAQHAVPGPAGSPPAAEGAASSAPTASDAETTASLLDGIPKNLPALLQAYQLTRRAARIGFDWERIEDVLDKVAEESAELRQALAAQDSSRRQALPADAARLEEEAGDLLFAAVNVARFLGLDPELALRKANQKFMARFREMEREAERSGRALAARTPEDMDTLWEQSKKTVPRKT